MIEPTTPGTVAHRTAASAESDQVGTPRVELLTALAQFRADCADPAIRDDLSIREVARISETLAALYLPPRDPPCRLYPLSTSAISEVLSGKRKGFPALDWVASYVLSCQLHATRHRPGRRDQGTTVLQHWADICAAHYLAAEPGTAPASTGPASAWQLPQRQQDFLLTHGPYGNVLLARAQQGHPHARYRAALLLATEPAFADDAVSLLISTASTGHPLSLDLLDAGPSPRTAGQRAWELAHAARASQARHQEYAFCRAAARSGISEATLALAKMLLSDIDPEAAGWLERLDTERPVGRHQALGQLAHPAEHSS